MSPDILEIVVIGVAVVLVSYLIYRFQSKNSVKSVTSQVSNFTIDLTQMARENKLDPVSGREKELERIIHIILRRTKNNPLIIGEPGVGKTAIVEALAQKIIAEDVPNALKNKTLLSLDLNQLMSGTQLRGELENRLQALLREMKAMDRAVILFIDEIHLLQQAGKSEGALSISDVIKPALARGELQLIGATTWQEYEEYIRTDEAFDRRMQPVLIDEPTIEVALQIVRALRPVYEKFHGVKITDEALETAVRMSDEKIDKRYLPDKAIDLIDEASAKVSIETENTHAVPLGLVHSASKNVDDTVESKDIEEVIEQWIIHDRKDEKRDARK